MSDCDVVFQSPLKVSNKSGFEETTMCMMAAGDMLFSSFVIPITDIYGVERVSGTEFKFSTSLENWEFEAATVELVDQWMAALSPAPLNKFSISDFTVMNVIGKGYSGDVVLARHNDTGRFVALKAIPKDASFFYSKKDMLPYREQIDKTVNRLMLFDKRARKADRKFYERLSALQRKIDKLCEPTKSGNHYSIDPQNITLIQEVEEDYKRRQGNIVLRAVKNIKPEIFERKYRHKVNDNRLKRNLAISHRKVGKLIGGFLSSFGEKSEYLSRDYCNRLQEIEEEMKEEREQQKAQETKVSRYDYGKE